MTASDGFEGTNSGFHVYGKSGALKFEAGLSAKREPVLVVDGGNKGPSGIDWDNKIVIHLSSREIPGFLCCVLGFTEKYDALHHGHEKNKSIHLVNQPERRRIFVKMARPEFAVLVPLPAEAVFRLGALALKVLGDQTGFDPATCLAVLKDTAGRLYSHPLPASSL
ncbi:hypothetical protein ACV344_33245 [Pseudomonas aeruginosa]|uniref:hypothetical protein n=1 Tax=Pseudomonas aeruginosa TaxID=287 RepID=UPI000F5296DF|nr:hypothetical protein [Pseudomonas aeruginosa]MBA5107688.1 hypothetical protein [Pseudomonas aeruginosa]MBD1300139.1 hypothetical protein [Pseudomonas aeruginosa]MBD1340704.1 hypothetical protein [Pseudomonas aeruginosa]MBG4604277.1 hypothetical protein [Pseudomonas aeruginosa]MBH3592848.1 hypothetical protein [Pseudomonas aeruginosa]